MEIIGRNIPQLQSAISSGLDNVKSGIAESVKTSGISALEDTFQIFSTSNMGNATDTYLLPAVSNVAEYSDPITALNKQATSSTAGAYSSLPLLQTMQNPEFTPEGELSTFTEAKVNETFKNLAKELAYKAESESAQGRNILKNDSLWDFGDHLGDRYPPETPDTAKDAEKEKWRQLKESLGQVDQLPYVTTDVGTAATKDDQSSVVSQIADAPGVATGSGSPSATASLEARGIIIVGGKTDGTYFQTIDDSMNDLRNNPQPEIAELLQNQVRAVQDMASESMKAVQLYRQYSDLRTSFRS